MAKSDIGSTVLSITVGAVGVYVILKFLPNYLNSLSRTPIGQAALNPALTAQNPSIFAVNNLANYRNADGSPFTAAQMDGLQPSYYDPTIGQTIPSSPYDVNRDDGSSYDPAIFNGIQQDIGGGSVSENDPTASDGSLSDLISLGLPYWSAS